jgi:hypothetical protein
MASLMYGINNLFAMNPGTSLDLVTILPILSANSFVILNVSSLVSLPGITSTNLICGTGFIKCIPIKFVAVCSEEGCEDSRAEASLVMGMDEVLVATMVEGRTRRVASTFAFVSKFSVTA